MLSLWDVHWLCSGPNELQQRSGQWSGGPGWDWSDSIKAIFTLQDSRTASSVPCVEQSISFKVYHFQNGMLQQYDYRAHFTYVTFPLQRAHHGNTWILCHKTSITISNTCHGRSNALLWSLSSCLMVRKAHSILRDSTHPGYHLFELYALGQS